MRLLPTLLITLLALLTTQGSLAASDRAFEVANPNAKFLRCATEHPSPREAKALEAQFQWRKAQAKKPSGKPGKGGGGGDTGDGRRRWRRYRRWRGW